MVSKGWHLMIEYTPWLWTYLGSYDDLSITTKALSLSKTAPLCIRCAGLHSAIRSFMDLVNPHIKRWRKAVLVDVPYNLLPNEVQPQEAPLLESLVVVKNYSNSLQSPFAGGPLPRLRYLYCKGVTLPWNRGLLSGLSSLTIDHRTTHVITTLDLAHILINNPLLTTLRIGQRHSPSEETEPDTFPILHRPHLKTIELDLPGCEEFARLLTWVVDRLLPSRNVEFAATLWLSARFPFEEETELRGFLRKLPRATNVYISDEYQPEALFNILSAALEDGEAVNGDRFLLQGMEEMMIVALECDWDGCLRMLEARARGAEGTLLPQVLKLRIIESELDGDVKQRIIDLLGQGNLIEGDSDIESDSNSELSVEY
ncbi:hypothetical protein FRC04_008497 [Tulasnella sp. 424]|nr:hypothetical protein FRC04_008497 [Tulasnella sp. 424]